MIVNMKSCAMREFVGLNDPEFTFSTFKEVLLNSYRDIYGDDPWTPPDYYSGAVLFSGAYNPTDCDDTWALAKQMKNNFRTQAKIYKRLEEVKKFIEEEEMGDIVEMPEFMNDNHKTMIVPFLWDIDPKGFNKAQKRWVADGVKPKRDENSKDVFQL